MSRLFVSALGALLFALCFPVGAQQPKKVPRIGYLAGAADRKSSPVEGFRQGLRDFGYVEGKNIQVEFRYTEGTTNPVPTLVAELVQLKPDVLVIGQGQTAIRAAKQATTKVPIVMITTVDPVAAELVGSLAHPGGNITGLTTLARELAANDWSCSRR